MIDEDPYWRLELIDFLIDGPDEEPAAWAGAFIMRTLQTGGDCRYRHDARRLRGARPVRAARAAICAALGALPEQDRRLLLRLLLLVPWEQNVRATGLALRIGPVIEVLAGVVGVPELLQAVGLVVESGGEAVRGLPVGDMLERQRVPGTEIVFKVSETERQALGLPTRRLAFDRVETAISGFRARGWESNLRVLVPWWLDALQELETSDAGLRLFADVRRCCDDSRGRYLLLGLLDWLTPRPKYSLAPHVLAIALDAGSGAVRKNALGLAHAMGLSDLLETARRDDPDRSVRKQAERLRRRR